MATKRPSQEAPEVERTVFTGRPDMSDARAAELDSVFGDISDVDDDTNLDGHASPPEAVGTGDLSELEAEDVNHSAAKTAPFQLVDAQVPSLASFGEGAMLEEHVAVSNTEIIDAPASVSDIQVQRWSEGEPQPAPRTRVGSGIGARPVADAPEARRLVVEAMRFIRGALDDGASVDDEAIEARETRLRAALEALDQALARLPS